MCDARTTLCKVITEQVMDTFEGQIRIFDSKCAVDTESDIGFISLAVAGIIHVLHDFKYKFLSSGSSVGFTGHVVNTFCQSCIGSHRKAACR